MRGLKLAVASAASLASKFSDFCIESEPTPRQIVSSQTIKSAPQIVKQMLDVQSGHCLPLNQLAIAR